METTGEVTEDQIQDVVHFLVTQKEVPPAAAIWAQYAGVTDITNPGFESEITRRGFDWRYPVKHDHRWSLERVPETAAEGNAAARLFFSGEENIDFHELYQIVPIQPGASYRLTYQWKSEKITTDMRPFVEIYGYDCDGLYAKGPMVMESPDWQTEIVAFTPPETCGAVVLRLRRLKSKRFDSKIAGSLWLDDFHLDTR